MEVYQFTWKDTNKKRGYGYITFDDSDVVDKVVLLGIHEVAGIKLQERLLLFMDNALGGNLKVQCMGIKYCFICNNKYDSY